MCGIAGYYGSCKIPETRIQSCLKKMGRRGPDSANHRHWQKGEKQIDFLHTRLNIIDLSDRSNQPFYVPPFWMIYNGELYNYVEIKQELARHGVVFQTTSDTEVLLSAIRQWGIQEALDRFEGMWAFALYNETDGSLTLCRDRFGEKPLYLYEDSSGVCFGSEVKLIASLLGNTLEINDNQLFRYLVNGYKSLYKMGETFYRGLREIKPATHIQFPLHEHALETVYWHPSFVQDEGMSREEAVQGVSERLKESVRLRLRADVPLAFCMSGGIDSNTLISIAKKELAYDVHGFTIQNTDARYEEQEMVDHAVQSLKIHHTSVPISTKNFIPRLQELISYHDGPVSTISYFAHWDLMQKISEAGYRISISGTAADELFTGYYDHHLAYLYGMRNNRAECESAKRFWHEHVKSIVRNPYLGDPELFVKNPDCRDHIFLHAEIFSKYLKKDWFEAFSEKKFTDDLLRNRMLNELFHEVVPVILHEDDLNAMYYSVENRSPYLDRKLFEFCQKMPTCYLIQNGYNKSVLRDAMEGILPEKIRMNRRKVGFNAPLFSYLDVHDDNTRGQLLDVSPIFDLVKRQPIEELLFKKMLPNSESKFLFNFLNAKLFLENHGSNNCGD